MSLLIGLPRNDEWPGPVQARVDAKKAALGSLFGGRYTVFGPQARLFTWPISQHSCRKKSDDMTVRFFTLMRLSINVSSGFSDDQYAVARVKRSGPTAL